MSASYQICTVSGYINRDANVPLVFARDDYTETTCLMAVVVASKTDLNRDDIYCVRITSGGKIRNWVDFSLKFLTVSVCGID